MALLSFIAGSTINANDFVFVDANGFIHKASANATKQATAAGIALDNGTVGSLVRVNPDGYVATFSGLSPGEIQYLSLTSGGITDYSTWINDLSSSTLPGAYLARAGTSVNSSGLDVELGLPVFVSSSGL